MKKNKVTVFNGHGRLTGPAKDGVHTIHVTAEDIGKPKDAQAEGYDKQKVQEVKGKKVVLATGSDARMLPGYKADETIMTNMEVLTIPSMPKSMVVIGSGAVGVEFASVFKSFGAEVTIIEALPRIVNAEDEEVSKELLRLYKKRGIEVFVGAKVEKIEKQDGGAVVSFLGLGGQAADEDGREGAGGGGTCSEDVRLRDGYGEYSAGARLCDDERMDGDDGAGDLCDRRYCGRAAAAGACGGDVGACSGGEAGGQVRAGCEPPEDSGMHLLRSADRQRGDDGGAGKGEGD